MARPLFRNRREAGERLAKELAHRGYNDPVVLALPRGGVPVAVPVAHQLRAPLDVLIVRKLGVPGREELAMGAIASIGGRIQGVRDERVVSTLGIAEQDWEAVYRSELRELRRREKLYLPGTRPGIEGRIAIIVDDGIATGSTVRAALAALTAQRPARMVVATPVAAGSTCVDLEGIADEVVCLAQPKRFSYIGQWYEDFRPVPDEEVRAELAAAPGWGTPD